MSNPPEKIRRFPALFRQNPRARAAIMRTYISKRKGDGGMRYSLYIDRIFVTHLTVNLCLLFLTAKSGGMDCRKGRIFRAAAAGAAMMTAALALPVPVQERELRLILKGIWLAAGVFAQLWIAFRCRNGKMLGRDIGSGHADKKDVGILGGFPFVHRGSICRLFGDRVREAAQPVAAVEGVFLQKRGNFFGDGAFGQRKRII